MPIREYQCLQCDMEFEELVFGDAVPSCVNCGSTKVEPLMSCCCVRNVGSDGSVSSSGSGCSGCSGGHCGTCH